MSRARMMLDRRLREEQIARKKRLGDQAIADEGSRVMTSKSEQGKTSGWLGAGLGLLTLVASGGTLTPLALALAGGGGALGGSLIGGAVNKAKMDSDRMQFGNTTNITPIEDKIRKKVLGSDMKRAFQIGSTLYGGANLAQNAGGIMNALKGGPAPATGKATSILDITKGINQGTMTPSNIKSSLTNVVGSSGKGGVNLAQNSGRLAGAAKTSSGFQPFKTLSNLSNKNLEWQKWRRAKRLGKFVGDFDVWQAINSVK